MKTFSEWLKLNINEDFESTSNDGRLNQSSQEYVPHDNHYERDIQEGRNIIKNLVDRKVSEQLALDSLISIIKHSINSSVIYEAIHNEFTRFKLGSYYPNFLSKIANNVPSIRKIYSDLSVRDSVRKNFDH